MIERRGKKDKKDKKDKVDQVLIFPPAIVWKGILKTR